MTRCFKCFMYATAILITVFVIEITLFERDSKMLPHRPQAQSYDQGNLKQNDNGCPTAIFVAPNGELQQCR